jgi:hypothetical protein
MLALIRAGCASFASKLWGEQEMSQDASLRQQLVKLLTGSEAHANFDAAIKDLPAHLRGERPKGGDHSPWELLEHLRIAQWDILAGNHLSDAGNEAAAALKLEPGNPAALELARQVQAKAGTGR